MNAFKQRKMILGIICFALSVLVIYYINTQTTLYADDYFYGTFFRGGLRHFLGLTKWHYLYFNGRIFVHFLLEVVLLADTHVFPFVNTGFLLAICYFSYRLQSEQFDAPRFFAYAALFLSAFMLLSVKLLRESYLWMSASFNYTLPLVMIFLLFCLQRRYTRTGKLRWYMVVVALLSGATTEQSGLAALFGVFVAGLIYRRREHFPFRKMLPFIIPCLIGCLTVFASPATLSRLFSDNQPAINSGSFFAAIIPMLKDRLGAMSGIMAASNYDYLFILFSFCAGFITFRDKDAPRILRLGFVFGGIVLILRFLSGGVRIQFISLCLSLVFLLLYAVAALKGKGWGFAPAVILTGLFSLLVMLLTNSVAYRTTLPFLLCLLAVCAGLMLRCIKGRYILLPAVLVLCCAVFAPTAVGYHKNKIVIDRNVSSIENPQGGDITYDMDLNDLYRYTMVQNSASYYGTFRDYYRIDPDRRIYFTSDRLAPIYANGERLTLPVEYYGGTPCMPIELVIEGLGGAASFSDGNFVMSYGGVNYAIDQSTQTVTYVKKGETVVYNLKYKSVYGLYLYLSAEDIENIFVSDK